MVAVWGHRGMGCTDGDFASMRGLLDGVSRPAENTIESIKALLAVPGVTGLETDVILTADNHLVLCHSDAVGLHMPPFTDMSRSLGTMTLQQISSLRVGRDGSGTIPTLAAVLDLLLQRPDFTLNLELKDVQGTNHPRRANYCDVVTQEIENSGFDQTRLRFSSFSRSLLGKLALRLFDCDYALLTGVPGVDEGFPVFASEPSGDIYAMFDAETVNQVFEIMPHISAFHVENRTVTPALMEMCKQRDYALAVWFWKEDLTQTTPKLTATINYARMIDLPLTIITDYAAERVKHLNAKTAQ